MGTLPLLHMLCLGLILIYCNNETVSFKDFSSLCSPVINGTAEMRVAVTAKVFLLFQQYELCKYLEIICLFFHISRLLSPSLTQWSDDMCSQFEFHGSQTQRQLKETLYDTIIDYFDKGKVSVVLDNESYLAVPLLCDDLSAN